MTRRLRRYWLGGLGVTALLFSAALGVAALDPFGLQKVAALTESRDPGFAPASGVDVAPLVRSIPDRGESGAAFTVYDVLPERKHRRTLVEGWGNCSNLVFGMAFELRRRGADYEIVHFMPRDTYLNGEGHTVLRTRFPWNSRSVVGLVDVVGRAIPRSGERPLDVADLGRGSIAGLTFEPIGIHDPRWERFYAADFQRRVMVGRITGRDVDRYFRFLEAGYVDLGLSPRLEKVLYEGLTVVLGFHPRIHVDSIAEARRGHALRFACLQTSLWVLRVAPLVALGLIGFGLGDRLTRA